MLYANLRRIQLIKCYTHLKLKQHLFYLRWCFLFNVAERHVCASERDGRILKELR